MSVRITWTGFVRWSPLFERFVVEDRTGSCAYLLVHSDHHLFARYFYKKDIPKFEVEYYIDFIRGQSLAYVVTPYNIFEKI